MIIYICLLLKITKNKIVITYYYICSYVIITIITCVITSLLNVFNVIMDSYYLLLL